MAKETLKIRVECYAGYRAEETPQRFFLGERQVDILDVIDRWLAPDYRYFKVRCNDDGIYILRHEVQTDQWELTLYDSGTHDELRLSST